MGFKVEQAGFQTLIQDSGRIGYGQFGVSGCGAMDDFAHRVGNILVGNNENEASLEVLLMGPTIVFDEDTQIAVTGADLGPSINGHQIGLWRSYKVNAGDILSFKGIHSGARAYIAIAGGIDLPISMGSKSTFTRAKIGGFEGRALEKNDYIHTFTVADRDLSINKVLPRKFIPEYSSDVVVRVVEGPQFDMFTDKGISTFLSSKYTVSNQADRMGCRFEGEEVEHIKSADIISDGISRGAIQIPGHGKPIVMLSDRQTTGGYTKIANVISVDLPVMAQLKPGDSVKFELVSIYEAHKLLREFESMIEDIHNELRSIRVIKAVTLRDIAV